jgi:hypothetical protein
MMEVLSPGVQDCHQPDLGSEMLGIAGGGHCFCGFCPITGPTAPVPSKLLANAAVTHLHVERDQIGMLGEIIADSRATSLESARATAGSGE